MADEDVSAKKEEAVEHHEAAAERAPGQPELTLGEGNQPPELGYAPPDTGLGDAESEIPTGVDQLDPDKVAAARQGAESGGADGDDGGEAFDVSAILAESDKANATAETDTGGDEGKTTSEGDET